MPSPSTSTLRIPSVSRSSLSHSIMVRPGMAAGPTGTTSSSRPCPMTNPPGCWERWRGNPTRVRATARACRRRVAPGSRPRARTASSPGTSPPQWAARTVVTSSDSPRALPASRRASRARKWITVAVSAARCRPHRSYTCWITSSRRSCSKSTSMSGGSPRSSDTKRSKRRSLRAGSTAVIPST